MDGRVSFVTLAVSDVGRARDFYVTGLGWTPIFDDGDVLMFQVADKVVLSLWDARSFAAEVGYEPVLGHAPITLAHNMATPEGVDSVLADVRRLGAAADDAVQRDWGGYSGYFADPDGYRWEIAYNPDAVGEAVL
jgi:hypothetical protein